MNNLGFPIYLLFVTSWFLCLPTRLPFLGALHFDLILVGILICYTLLEPIKERVRGDDTFKYLAILIVFALFAIPFAQWPGSAIKFGIESLVKAVVFYYFTVAFITTETRLKVFIIAYIACQSFRVFEPLYLHITEGYWGSMAYAEGGSLNRLSGGSHDQVNPNGLAFIIVSILPFYHYMSSISWKTKLLYASVFPPLIYALVLTSSRSGMIGLFIIYFVIFLKSKRKALMAVLGVLLVVIAFANLSPEHKDRYFSLISSESTHSESADFRKTFNIEALKTTFHNPLFGYGLSTSYEVNCNVIGRCLMAHNLYIEVAQEIGYIGLFIFIMYMYSIIKSFKCSAENINHGFREEIFLNYFTNSVQVWIYMSLIFSFASYGFLLPLWYLFGGFSVVLRVISGGNVTK